MLSDGCPDAGVCQYNQGGIVAGLVFESDIPIADVIVDVFICISDIDFEVVGIVLNLLGDGLAVCNELMSDRKVGS